MSQVGELFSLDELKQLTVPQLKRVMIYLSLSTTENPKRQQMIDAIMSYQKVTAPAGYNYSGNPDWQDGVPRSVRVQRIYEANKQGRRI